MSEKLSPNGAERLAKLEVADRQRENLEKLRELARSAELKASSQSIEALHEVAKTEAISGVEAPVGDANEASSQKQHFGVHKALKIDAYQKVLAGTQKRLSVPDRAFSKVIHNKAVEAVSEVAAKTIARPSGLLGGGIAALIGSAWIIYVATNAGFRYNYAVFFMLLGAGFVLGICLELLAKPFTRKSSR